MSSNCTVRYFLSGTHIEYRYLLYFGSEGEYFSRHFCHLAERWQSGLSTQSIYRLWSREGSSRRGSRPGFSRPL